MAMVVLNYVKNLWPLSIFKFDDLRASNSLVKKLNIPETTKGFVYAIQEPESQAVIYVLCVQNLSERSALDAECLIREVKPDAVMVQVGPMAMENGFGLDEIVSKDCGNNNIFSWIGLGDNGGKEPDECTVPTSSLEVLRSCFLRKINKEKYENVAENFVLKEIFGVGFNGHLQSAKRAAEEVGSSFLLFESPFVKCGGVNESSDKEEVGNKLHTLGFQPSNLVPNRAVSLGSVRPYGLDPLNGLQSQMLRSMSTSLLGAVSVTGRGTGSEVVQPRKDYKAPQFAQSLYPLLLDLHDAFPDLPSVNSGLAHAQNMLFHINNGENVDSQLLSEVYVFRIAVEVLRIALNSAGRVALDKLGSSVDSETTFSELPIHDRSHALLAEALRSQTKEFKSIVAVVDSSCLGGLRRHWNTPIPLEIKNLVKQLIIVCEGNKQHGGDRKRLLADKPVVAVGAGATAILGASSLSKVVPASTFAKIFTFKVPASFKIAMTQTQKILAAFVKTTGPSKAASGMASGVKTSGIKAVASAERTRAVVHSSIAFMERTSLSATRTIFYEIMRKRHFKKVGFLPWATFGCSIATCASLLAYGDGIECVAESLPAAPSIASLGRGIQNLHQASQAIGRDEYSRIQKSMESLLSRFWKIDVQK